ncbi:MAG: FdhF/YdeP family oxidoreductase [Chloroflexi bacterium]|nr:FdhF/YdeP family oxidoreductase [Chloroflexota bacterium]
MDARDHLRDVAGEPGSEPSSIAGSDAQASGTPDPRATFQPPRKKARRIAPNLWAGLVPNGLDQQKPNHYWEMVRTIWENRRHPFYALRILRKGVCDGCALGVAGFKDWTMDGVHLCTTRLNLLQVNTMDALDPRKLAVVDHLRELDGTALRKLGRLPYPMIRRRGDLGFRRIGWDEALDLAAERIRGAKAARGAQDPGADRFAFFLTARGITNETYYVAQKVARFLGTNNVDNAARICHAPSTGALKRGVGVAATTCDYRDVIESDLTVLFGADVANAQPVFMKYLYLAKKRGGKVAVVNPYREPGLERYWVPSNAESAVFGTKITDEFFPVHVGGDIAFLNGVLKVLIEENGVDDDFVTRHTDGWPELRAELAQQTLEDLARWSGSSVEDFRRFARMYAAARSAVLVWSMGITQHVCGTDNVAAIINLALARGNVGRPGAGLMPIRGHSGVQGGAEMGCYATVLPGGVPIEQESAEALTAQYGFRIGAERGLSAAEMVEASGRGELDVLWSVGGNFLDTLPEPAAVHAALERVPLRVHQDIIISSQMLVDPGDTVLLLPATTRYEQPGGGTETTTERRVAFSPEIPGPRIGEARSEWQVLLDLAARVDPVRAAVLCSFESAQEIREEIACVVPYYDGVQHLKQTGDAIQWGGARLCEGWVFPTPNGRANFVVVRPRERELPAGRFLLSTRRGKQFNSMVWRTHDPLTGADRDALFMAPSDAQGMGLGEGDTVLVRSASGEVRARIKLSTIRPGNLQMFFPEANPVIPSDRRDPVALVPDYNATVEVLPLGRGGSPLPEQPRTTQRRAAQPRAERREAVRPPSGSTAPTSGIVLAGGRSSRFGRDKLAEPLDGRPLLHHAIRALASVCTEVIVVAPAGGLAVALPADLPVPLRVVTDRTSFGGPLLGLAAGAERAREAWLLVVGGDMPGLEPAVLREMLRAVVAGSGDRYGAGQGAALELDGAAQRLPLVLHRGVAIAAAGDLASSGERSLGALLSALDVVIVPEDRWRRLDPGARTLHDIDVPADLASETLEADPSA